MSDELSPRVKALVSESARQKTEITTLKTEIAKVKTQHILLKKQNEVLFKQILDIIKEFNRLKSSNINTNERLNMLQNSVSRVETKVHTKKY
jgi:uncharacterized small protein (DUF1192 family)